MSHEHSPARVGDEAGQGGILDSSETDLAFWNALIDSKMAGEFLGLSDRFMQDRRQLGGGPKYIVVSARCVRYRRCDLRAWSEARFKTSTSDVGVAAA